MDLPSIWKKHAFWIVPGLIVAALYFQVRGHDFVDYDDFGYTYENPHVATGLTWENIRWAWTTSHFANYHPLTWISHMATFQLFGGRPGPEALVNASLHAANAMLVALLFSRLFRSRWCGFAAGALFALHPALVEAVAWVSQRKTTLSTFFALLSILAYLAARNPSNAPGKQRWFWVASFATYFASLCSKGMFVTLPVLLLLLDWVRADQEESALEQPAINRETVFRTAFRLWPYALLALLFSIATYAAQSKGGATTMVHGISVADKVATAAHGYVAHLTHFIYPLDLSVLYPFAREWNAARLVLHLALLAAITAGAWSLRRFTGKSVLYGWLFFLVGLLPVIGFVQIGVHGFADRYAYGPMLGLLIMGITLVKTMLRNPSVQPLWRRVIPVGVALWAAMLGIICHAQVGAWENSYTLAALSERSVGKVALFSYMKSRILAKNGQLPEAVALAREARQLDPESLFMLQNQVLLEVDAGNLAEAERLCREHMQRAPDQLSPFYHYAIICVLQQRWTDAEAAIAEVLKRQAQRPRMTVSQKQGLAELQRRIEEGKKTGQSQR